MESGKIVTLKPVNHGSSDFISQLDFAEFMELRKRLAEAREQYEKKRKFLVNALRGGAKVEPGPLRPKLHINVRLNIL